MKEEREILSGIDAPLKKRQGGAIMAPPPGKLGLRGTFQIVFMITFCIFTITFCVFTITFCIRQDLIWGYKAHLSVDVCNGCGGTCNLTPGSYQGHDGLKKIPFKWRVCFCCCKLSRSYDMTVVKFVVPDNSPVHGLSHAGCVRGQKHDFSVVQLNIRVCWAVVDYSGE